MGLDLMVAPAPTRDETARAAATDAARRARAAAPTLATCGTKLKNAALDAMAHALGAVKADLLDANACDLAAARENGVAPHMVDRLTLTEGRIVAMQEGLRQVAALPDPVGNLVGGWTRPNGLQISKVRVPLGVIGIIYESRPNVTVDAAALCLKAGNAVVLRGGSEAIHSNTALAHVLRVAAEESGLPADVINLIENTDRAAAHYLMTLNKYVDCLIPRGGAGLIASVVQNATVPVIETGTGNCHIYVDPSADPDIALRIIINAKCQRPSVCNAAETLLVHSDHLALPFVGWVRELQAHGVEVRGCPRTLQALRDYPASGLLPAFPATDGDYATEFNDLVIAVKIVDSLDEAIDHINHFGTRHSEAIITTNYAAAQRFTDRVDAAAVYVNASTRFTDGYEFGFGAEIGISNQKLHARGPMGLEELTTTKYIVRGDGQVR